MAGNSSGRRSDSGRRTRSMSKSAIARRKRARRRKQLQLIAILITGVAIFIILIVLAIKLLTGGKDEEQIETTTPYVPMTTSYIAPTTAQVPMTQATLSQSKTTSKGNIIEVKDGVTYIDGLLIVNKTYGLPSDFIPQNPESPVTTQKSNTALDVELMEAFRDMQKASSAAGMNIYISSGYRSYSYQNTLYNNYVNRDGKAKADAYSARPGYSEHQTGLCIDLNTIDDSFAETSEGKWVNENCYKYGFILRYPKGKEAKTGYMYESWHLRYVGVELAGKLYNGGDWITLEEHFGITSEYTD